MENNKLTTVNIWIMFTYSIDFLLNYVQLFLDLNLIVKNNKVNKFIPIKFQCESSWA